MTEKELLEKIRSSAEEIEVPESLSPDWIKKKLDVAVGEGKIEKSAMEDESETEKFSSVSKKIHWNKRRKVVVAAAMLLVCGTGAVAAYQLFGGGADIDMATAESAEESADIAAESAPENAKTGEADAVVSSAENRAENIEKKDAGEMYVVAKNYGEVYDLLKGQEEKFRESFNSMMTDGAAGESAEMEKATGTAQMATSSVSDLAGTAEECMKLLDSTTQEDKEYSKTNLQTAGVDESDIIKTDGDYIYVVDNDTVEIIDIRETEMKEMGEIEVSLGSAADRVVEMFVDGDILNLIIEKEKTELETEASEGTTSYVTEGEEIVTCDVYYVNTNVETELQTYDISNRKKPVLKGSMTQDGTYKTSRKVGDIVYLFTEKYVELPDMTKRQATADEEVESWIPLVNDRAIAADCIYLPKQGENGLIVSSVDVEKPDKVVDNTLIMNDYVNIYVSTSAIYLYETDYSGSRVSTQIAKFSFDKGIFNAVAATSATGEVYDTFAINEYQGKLRLLTTDWTSEEQENQLFLFDEKLNLTGSLKGIAEGEQIYAARYLGDMVYFVTYRNTDPLFAVDLSDEKNPKILSELKITGFSEYLHFWGEDKLVGIGYETDPNTGEQKGLKLSMFDISNPAKLTTVGTCVTTNADYSPALYNYKCVLVDEGENLIGFATESYDRGANCNYLLFTWEDGEFESLLSEKLDSEESLYNYRGIYVGDIFYLVNTGEIISYDREDAYKMLQTLEW